MVVCADEKTDLQPRPRLAATKPARPGQPIRLEHGYKRAGALHPFAAFDTRREGLRSHGGAQAAKRVHRLAHPIGSGDSTFHSSHLSGPR